MRVFEYKGRQLRLNGRFIEVMIRNQWELIRRFPSESVAAEYVDKLLGTLA